VRALNIPTPWRADGPLWGVARRYLWTLPIAAVLAFLSSLLEGAGVSLLIPLFGTLMGASAAPATGPAAALFHLADGLAPERRLTLIALAILALVVVKCVVQAGLGAFVARIDARAGHDVRTALSRRVLGARYPFFLQEDPARLFNILSVESWRASDSIRIGFGIVQNLVGAVVFAILLIVLHWRLALVVAVGILLIRLVQMRFVRAAERIGARLTDSNARLGEHMWRSINGMRAIRLFGQEDQEHRYLVEASEAARRASFSLGALSSGVGASLEAAHAALFVAVLIGATAAGVPTPVLLAFLVLLYRAQPFVRAVSHARVELAGVDAAVKEVEWLLDTPSASPSPKGDRRLDRLDGPIVFEEVSFHFAGERQGLPALKHVSFTIEPGRTTALVGPSGSGKSTVINLICRLLEPTEGRITVAGVPLSELDPAAWRAHIGIAGQDVDLLDGTIADNVRFGDLAASDEAIAEAARLAQIDAFIESLPGGYDTDVGALGLRLSGGQRQRIGIARALGRRTSLLILDEATSAVDGLSESAILALLKDLPWENTKLLVSHRASALSSCDHIVRLGRGGVLAAGPLAAPLTSVALSNATTN
jgi:ABC-type multidrug transport system fused ATPase/permease subunit